MPNSRRSFDPRRKHVLLAVVVAAAAIALAPAARAQNSDYRFNVGPATSPRKMMADHLAMLAHEVLAGAGKPRSDQWQRARILLDLAVKLSPRDAELWRLSAELASRMDDDAAWQSAFGHYLDLDPTDDAGQLKLILAQLNTLQTVDQRLSRVSRILDAPQARQFSAPLRSRLASYAAAAAHQLGDSRQFVERLGQAASLDPTNKQAAMMIYRLAQQRHASPLLLGTALINLVQAAPLDGSVRVRLARVLAGQAVYGRAARQFRLGQSRLQQQLPDDVYRQWVLSLAAAGQTASARQLLDEIEQSQHNRNNQSSRTMPAKSKSVKAGKPGKAHKSSKSAKPAPKSKARKPAAAGLAVQLELLRLGIASVTGDQDTTHAAFERIRKQLDAAASKGRTWAPGDLAWVAAVFNIDTSLARGYLARAKADQANVNLVRGWLALHRRRAQAAERDFKKIAGDNPMARYGLALLSGPDQASRVHALVRVVKSAPRSLAAMLAAMKLQAMHRTVYPTDIGGSLDVAMGRLPSDLWRLLETSTWVDMHLKVTPARVTYLQPIQAAITIRDASQLPLAIGPDSPLHANVLLQVAPFINGNFQGALPAKVVDADRRLSLNPGEKFVVTVRLDRSAFGWMLLRHPFTPVMYNVTAQVDPRIGAAGRMAHGPLGSSDTDRSLQAWILPATTANLKDWLDQVRGNDAFEQAKAIARLVQAGAGAAKAVDAKMLKRIADTINSRFPGLDRVAQAWTVLCITDHPADRRRFARVFDLAMRSSDPLVRITYLATKVTDPASPQLSAAIRSNQRQIHTFAAALQQGLEAAAKAEAAKNKKAVKGAKK